MIEIFIACALSTCCFLGYGNFFYRIIEKNNTKICLYEEGIFGAIFLSFLSIFLNFFLPLNNFIGTIILIIGLIFFFQIYRNKKKSLKILIYISLISFLLITLSNINRPDSGLYHLPYINILNENKIIFGLTNLHFRFGHTSSLQYLSAVFYNNIFKVENILIPPATLASLFFGLMTKKFLEFLKEKNLQISFCYFLFLIFSIYSFNRYSNFGNDAHAHMIFFLIIILVLEKIQNNLWNESFLIKIFVLSIFLVSLKVFMILIAPLILFILLKYKNKFLIFSKFKFLIIHILILILLLKNLIISSCLFYPINSSCLNNLIFSNQELNQSVNTNGEAWAKGWPDLDVKNNKNITSPKIFNKNLNWISTWKKKHLKIVNQKLSPILLFLLSLFLLFYFYQKKNNNFHNDKYNKNYRIFFLPFIISFFCLILWFLKFPLYRYGSSFLISFFTFAFLLFFFKFIKNIDFYFFKKICLIILAIFIIGGASKNLLRIFDNLNNVYYNYPWPKIYTLSNIEENKPKKLFKIYNLQNKFLYYFSPSECMYNKAPCSNYKIKNLKMYKKLSYKFFYIKN